MTQELLQRSGTTGEFKTQGSAVSQPVGNGLLGVGATAGFVALPTSAAAPNGVPADIPAGFVAACFCTGDNKIYVYDGAWLASAALA